MYSTNPPNNEEIQIKALENAVMSVSCRYKEIEVCQESLLSKFAPEIIVNDIAFNLKYERPLVRQWHSNGSSIETIGYFFTYL